MASTADSDRTINMHPDESDKACVPEQFEVEEELIDDCLYSAWDELETQRPRSRHVGNGNIKRKFWIYRRRRMPSGMRAKFAQGINRGGREHVTTTTAKRRTTLLRTPIISVR